MYVVLPSWIGPDSGYIVQYSPYQCQAPIQGNPNQTQTGQGVPQAGPPMWLAPMRNPTWSRIPQVESYLDSSRGRAKWVWYGDGRHSKQLESY